MRVLGNQPVAQQESRDDQQKDRQERRDNGDHGVVGCVGESRANRSSAPCRMKAAASVWKALRATVVTPVASRRSGSLAATPMVLVPRSRPTNAPRAGSSGAISTSGRTGMANG